MNLPLPCLQLYSDDKNIYSASDSEYLLPSGLISLNTLRSIQCDSLSEEQILA
jgi:hypothetical protein